MPTVTKDDFLKCLRASQVVDEADLKKILAEADSEDARALAIRFVDAGLLTRWQAKYLMGGRHILTIGNYRLLERLGRHEIYGDQFRAVHLQLGRKVQLQILPTALNQDDERRERFMEKAASAANLDHPNLIHVYDIDREGGRLILVSELVEGIGLDEYPVEELSDVDVARIVKQAVSAVREAHKEGIVHGQIEYCNLLITKDEYVKLRHLVLSSLDEVVVQTTPQDDVNTIGKIGVQLLATTAHSAGPKPKKQLYDLISWLSTTNEEGLEQILPKLDEWINVFNASTTNSISGISPQGLASPSSKSLEAAATADANTEEQPALLPGALPIGQKQTSQATPPRSTATSGETKPPVNVPKKVSPATLVTTVVVGGLMLVAGVAGFAWIMNGGGDSPSAKNNSNSATRETSASKNEPASDKLKTKPTKLEVTNDELDEMLAKGASQPPNRAPLANTDSKTAPPAAETKQPADGQAKTTPAPSSQAPGEQSQTAAVSIPPSSNQPAAQPPGNSTNVADTTKSSVDQPSPKDGTEVVSTPPKQPVGNSDQPFANFPADLQLPELAAADEVSIGPIAAPSNYLLTAELLSGPEICKAKIQFELIRDPADKQRWLVNFQRRKTDEPVPVAAFRFDGTTMFFQWLPEAASDEYTQHLRNCQVKFTAKQKFGYLTLRKPFQIDGFQITEEELGVSIETDVKWLPDPDNLVIELQPFKYGDLQARLVNRTVARKTPGAIFFSEKQNQQFAWLEIAADTRKQLELSLDLKFGIPRFRANKTAFKRLAKLGQDLKAKADFASAEYERIKDLNTPEGMSYDDWRSAKSKMKSSADDAQSLASDTIELTKNLKNLFGKQIPVVVYFEMNGNRIILAESKASE